MHLDRMWKLVPSEPVFIILFWEGNQALLLDKMTYACDDTEYVLLGISLKIYLIPHSNLQCVRDGSLWLTLSGKVLGGIYNQNCHYIGHYEIIEHATSNKFEQAL